MNRSDSDAALERVRVLAAQREGLQLLVLFGSRARGDAADRADWDFGYLADDRFDASSFTADLVLTIGSDHLDLVDLKRAGGLLRFRAARDGVLLFERNGGLANRFRLEAARFWVDAEPVLRRGYEAILERLG